MKQVRLKFPELRGDGGHYSVYVVLVGKPAFLKHAMEQIYRYGSVPIPSRNRLWLFCGKPRIKEGGSVNFYMLPYLYMGYSSVEEEAQRAEQEFTDWFLKEQAAWEAAREAQAT